MKRSAKDKIKGSIKLRIEYIDKSKPKKKVFYYQYVVVTNIRGGLLW